MRAVFITGSGTGIGKTHVACALIRSLRAQGASVAALKPVVSGYDTAAPQGSDPWLLLEALGEPPTAEALARMAPFAYSAPLAPDRAARLEGRELRFEAVLAACRARMAQARGLLLIEGAGGVMSPLSGGTTNLDLIAALGVPTVLVTGSYLGAISHGLTALAVLEARGLRADVAVSESADSVGLEETAAALRAHIGPVALYPLPRSAHLHREGALLRLAEAVRADP